MVELKIAKGEASAKINIKRSVFIATAKAAKSVQEAKEFIREVSKKYRDATHNCWAYRVYESGAVVEHSSDAGEPSGTAGLPILGAIKSMEIFNVAVVVSRYFGGVKLGVRGLREAYSKAARLALEKLRVAEAREVSIFEVKVKIEDYGRAKAILSKSAKILSEEFEGSFVNIRYAANTLLLNGAKEMGKMLMDIRDFER